MARNNSGIPDNFIGTIGPVTDFMRNGQDLLRSSTSSAKNEGTPLQLADLQQAIFILHAGFRKDKKASLNITTLQGHTVETGSVSLSPKEKGCER